MVELVSRNTVQLNNDASSVDDYYLKHRVSLTRTDSLGKQTTQVKNIVAYNGASRTVTIEGLWESDFTPTTGDKVKIVPKHADSRVSINPAIQTLDYISSKTYGRGLDPIKDLELPTWLNSARICDTRSDIYIRFTGSAPTLGAIYTTAPNLWQGTVAEIINDYIRFTDIIGKLSYKWNDWRNFVTNNLVYEESRLYRVSSAGIKTTKPIHTSGTVNGLEFVTAYNITKVSGTGPATIPIYIDGNPIRFVKKGIPVSGYTLYDSDGVDYFRLIGWDVNEQRSVTRHQTNISIDTSLPLFENTNSMLQHFGGILRYSGSKYALEVEGMDGPIDNVNNEPRNITDDHIIGKINITDDGVRSAFNSLTVAYSDPANKFEARNISFFNSDYLKADRNTPKKGNLTIPGVTNYYNARILADKFLTRSRYGTSITLNLAPRGTLLLAGKVIQLQYPRYNWVDKKFRIENLVHNDDCTVDITATEYDDSFYTISNVSKPAGVGLAGSPPMSVLGPPTNLVTTNVTTGNELVSAIELSWSDSTSALSPNVETEIYSSYSPHLVVGVTSITGNQTLTTTEVDHGLDIGQPVAVGITQFGLTEGTIYYVKSVPSANTFTLSLTRDGPTITNLANTVFDFDLTTAVVIGTVTPPINTYVDTNIYNSSGNRVQKYYWLRYRVNQQ